MQEKIARKLGCGYFDSYRYMGGRESMVRWACRKRDRYAMLDLVHLTTAGYRHLADTIGRALKQIRPGAARSRR